LKYINYNNFKIYNKEALSCNLKIQVCSAVLNLDLDVFGKMDPFCKIVFNQGGTDPVEYQTEAK
jgi:hypothetical protein